MINYRELAEQLNSRGTSAAPLPTLAERKLELLTKNKLDKLAGIDPASAETPQENYDRFLGVKGSSEGFMPSMKSSMYQAGGTLRDVYADSYNRLADETGLFERDESLNDDSEWNRRSEVEYADRLAGYNRESYSTAMTKLSDQVSLANTQLGEGQILDAIGNYGSAFVTAAGQADEYAGQSMGSMTELAAGTLMVAGTAALLPQLGTAAVILGSIAKVAPKTAKLLAWTAKKLPAASIYGADMTHGYASEYEKATGEKKPLGEIVTDFTLASLLGVVQLGTIGRAASNMTMGTFKNTMGHLAETLKPKGSAFKTLADTVWAKSLQIAETAGAEAGQEFLETWHEIIAGDKKAIGVQLSSKENWDKAVVGAIAGLTTGGAIAAAPAAVTLPVSAGMSATKGTVKYAGNKIADFAVGSSYKILPEEDRQAIADKYEAEDEVHKMYSSELDVQNEKLKSMSKTEAALNAFINDKSNIATSGKLSTAIDKIKIELEAYEKKSKGKPMPQDTITRIINKGIAANNSAITSSATLLEISKEADATYRVYNNVKKAAEKALKSEPIAKKVKQAKEVYKVTKDFAGNTYESTKETVKNLNTSAAKGYLDFVIDGRATNKGTDAFKASDISKELDKVANKISNTDLETLISLAEKDSVVLKALTKVQDARIAARKSVGLMTDMSAVIAKDSMIAKATPNMKIDEKGVKILYNELQKISGSTVLAGKAKKQLDIALEVVKNSKGVTEKQYNTLAANVRRGYTPDAIAEAASTVVDGAKKAYTKVKQVSSFDDLKGLTEEVFEGFTSILKKSLAKGKALTTIDAQAVRKGEPLGLLTHKAMTDRTVKRLIEIRGTTNSLKPLEKIYYEKYPDRVHERLSELVTVKENIFPAELEQSSSDKNKESTISDTESGANTEFETREATDKETEAAMELFVGKLC